MRYIITNQQINFYVEHGYIEFEDLLSDDVINNCRNEFSNIVKNMNSKTVYLQGRDLWRQSTVFSKIAKNKNLASIVTQLVGKDHLRLAFDQISLENFPEQVPLHSFFSFQKLICIVVFYFDSEVNSCIFINPNHAFVSKEHYKHLYFIGYAPQKTLYISNPRDWNTNYLKKFGYSFGDCLKEEFHPTIS